MKHASPRNPTDIARETIRQLAVRHLPPTPGHYQEIYAEIAGSADVEAFPERAMKQMALELAHAACQPGLERALVLAVAQKDWAQFSKALIAPLDDFATQQRLAWNTLIRDLFRQWENTASSLSTAQKREALEHVLQSAGGNPAILFARLENLNKSWAQSRNESMTRELERSDAFLSANGSATLEAPANTLLPELRKIFAYALENCLHAFLTEDERLARECRDLVEEVRYANTGKQFQALERKLKGFIFRLELLDEDHRELRDSLLKLLRLVLENVGELVLDDQWIHGQIEVVRDIVNQPLSQKSLDDAEARIREVVFKQSQLKLGLQEAQNALKSMLAGFVDHLNHFTGATSDYHDKIGVIANRISQADKLADLESLLPEIMRETRVIQISAHRSRDELLATQARVRKTEARVRELEQELAQTSELVRHDQLTGTLNRRGLEECYEKEAKRAERRQIPLCLALLDIDNFKTLNDTLGHAAGDDALVHLTQVVRRTLRPEDSFSRYGGEEFILLFPDATLQQAAAIMTRIQRELTRHIFLHHNQKVLITFSAGIALRQPDETRDALIHRADAAMYEAKQSGKNRVVTTPPCPEADGARPFQSTN
ncbi:MAG: GGDEF domain-containing protein [Zoogloeaceae bacterium]|jgi:diguanylate cyclase|nr:GGDEF domain-containing protein [Zoogloeaceae bacterium]